MKEKRKLQIYTNDPHFHLSWWKRRKYNLTLVITDTEGMEALEPMAAIMAPVQLVEEPQSA